MHIFYIFKLLDGGIWHTLLLQQWHTHMRKWQITQESFWMIDAAVLNWIVKDCQKSRRLWNETSISLPVLSCKYTYFYPENCPHRKTLGSQYLIGSLLEPSFIGTQPKPSEIYWGTWWCCELLPFSANKGISCIKGLQYLVLSWHFSCKIYFL